MLVKAPDIWKYYARRDRVAHAALNEIFIAMQFQGADEIHLCRGSLRVNKSQAVVMKIETYQDLCTEYDQCLSFIADIEDLREQLEEIRAEYDEYRSRVENDNRYSRLLEAAVGTG